MPGTSWVWRVGCRQFLGVVLKGKLWLWSVGGATGDFQLVALGGVLDHVACSPYRLMERFLMDGLYPSRLEMLLVPAALPPSCQLTPMPTPVPQWPRDGGR